MSSKRIFISYSRSDLEFVEKLVAALKPYGLDVWFDKHLRTGGDWDDKLEEEINRAEHMIIVWSKRSVQSDNVKNEISFAKRSQTALHPIKIEDCESPISMARMHYRNFTGDFDEAVKRLVEDILELEGGSVKIKAQATTKSKNTSKTKKLAWLAIVIILGYFAYTQLQSKPITETETEQPESKATAIIDYQLKGRYVILGPNPGGLWASPVGASKKFLWHHIVLYIQNDCKETIYIDTRQFRLYLSTKIETENALSFSPTEQGMEFQTDRIKSQWLEPGQRITGDFYFKVPERYLSNGIDMNKTYVYNILRYRKEPKCEITYSPY